ncbi:response regulator [bacterium]|nr:response regulator [bacterium]
MVLKILVVDDFGPFRDAFRTIWHEHISAGEILEADNGDSAISMAREHQPDLIFLDIEMPIDGFIALESIHRQWPEIKIVMLSVHTKKIFVEKSLALGAIGYLVKKCIKQELTEAMKKFSQGEQFISKDINSTNTHFN